MKFSPALFSTRAKGTSPRRTIFVDIKATKDKKPYMKITESSIDKDGEKKKSYLTVFEDEMVDFKQAIEDAISFARTE